MANDLAALYREHAQRLLVFLSARCSQNDVDDLAHDIWVKAARSMELQFDGENFRAWLFQIARNHLKDYYRKPPHPGSLSDSVPVASDPSAGLLHEERESVLRDCLKCLTPRELCVFESRRAGDEYEVVCNRCECEINGAQKALHSAKRKLRECVERKLK
jgi:RNA polymerase sigma factor (sigma-70 family)